MQRVLGIDLGTTNSVMAVLRRGEPQVIPGRDNSDLTPSVVGRGKKGDLLVGSTARSRALLDAENTIYSIKRLMGRRFKDQDVKAILSRLAYRVEPGDDGDVRVRLGQHRYTPIEISALILRRLKQDAEDRLHDRITRAVITVPAYFGERQVAATREAGRLAGFQVLRIINEPTAAALAYGLTREPSDGSPTVLIYDLGGGTFDISIIMLMEGAFTVIGIEGDNLLGGDDFDRLLTERLLKAAGEIDAPHLAEDPAATQKLRIAAEAAKIGLSSQSASDVIVPAIGRPPVDIETEITRAEFEAMMKPTIARTVDLTMKALADSHLTPADIDQVLLVGGSTSIPLVRTMLSAVFGEDKIRSDVNPMQCVALGAAVQSALIEELECTSCGKHNPVDHDDCSACGAPLYGTAKVDCPECYMPCDIALDTCWKCGGSLTAAVQPLAPPATTDLAADQPPVTAPMSVNRCATCGKPLRPAETECSICGRVDRSDPGGLKCASCGTPNRPGVTVCMSCGADIGIATPDITPKDLGIELNDGSMAVVLPKGTSYPTVSLHTKDFSTVVERQARLEVQAFEGPHRIAQQNELCGYITMPLPEGLPRGTPVSVSFGLDTDRTITVRVRVRTSGSADKEVRLQHFGRLDAEHQRLLEGKRAELVAWIDEWSNELKPAESRVLFGLIDEVDFKLGGAGNGQPVDSIVSRMDKSLAAITKIRGRDAYISAVLRGAGKYITEVDRQHLQQLQDQLVAARDEADWEYANTIADNAEAVIDAFGEAIRHITYVSAMVAQDALSPAMDRRAIAVLREIEESLESGNEDRTSRAMAGLIAILPEVLADAQENRRMAPSVTGLQ